MKKEKDNLNELTNKFERKKKKNGRKRENKQNEYKKN